MQSRAPVYPTPGDAAPGRGAGREAEVGGKEAEVGTSENQELLGAAGRESARIGWRRGRRCRIADRLEEKGLEPRDWRVGTARLLEQSPATEDSRCWRPAPSLFTSLLPSLVQNPRPED